VVAALNRPGIAKAWKEKVPLRRLPSVRIASPPVGGIAGTLHIEVTTFPEVVASTPPVAGAKAKPQPQKPASPSETPHTVHLLVVPDGSRSWIAISSSEDIAKAKVALAVGAHSTEGTLTTRAGLEGFRESRMAAGGFFTVRSLMALAEDVTSSAHVGKRVDWKRLLQMLPSKGATPVLVTSSPAAPTADEPGGLRDVHMTFPADAIRDAIRFTLAVDMSN